MRLINCESETNAKSTLPPSAMCTLNRKPGEESGKGRITVSEDARTRNTRSKRARFERKQRERTKEPTVIETIGAKQPVAEKKRIARERGREGL